MSSRSAELTRLILETFRLNGALVTSTDRLASSSRLSTARWRVLELAGEETLTVSGMARRLGLARQSVQRTVDQLLDADLLELEENPDHRRAKLVRPTPDGRRLLARFLSDQSRWSRGIAAGFSAAELERTTGTLRRIRERVERDV